MQGTANVSVSCTAAKTLNPISPLNRLFLRICARTVLVSVYRGIEEDLKLQATQEGVETLACGVGTDFESE